MLLFLFRHLFCITIIIAMPLPTGVFADDSKRHNFAEGDNPNLDEAALQGTKNETKAGESDKSTTANWSQLSSMMEKLMIEYYPKAKIKKGKNQLHVEYKTRPFDIPSTNTIEPGPDWGGILCDTELKEGPYAGV